MTASNDHAQDAVVVSALTKTYKGSDVSALNGISFSVTKGEVFGLIGPNGAGKTTLIGCLLGLLRPDAGDVSIFGLPADSLAVRRITGYVPERSDFEHWMTARQFLKYHHGLAGRNGKDANGEIDECLEAVQLSPTVWNRRLKTYSRGMLQRLNIAQMLIGKPTLALLDEPTLGLDPNGVTLVRNLLRKMQDDGVTIIVNSHQLDEVERVCDRVAFIKQGKIGSIENIKTGALSRYSLLVRWPESALNGSLNSVVEECANRALVNGEECHHSWGRFTVQDNKAAANLIKELVSNGLPVEEAVPEKNRLEELFAAGGENKIDE
ncbi:MAG: ABC transporter ATP-binding protein [Leptolyngbya sp.]|nr:ABC transporter ATP-binding protein [Candidatus Melainabacteria bacterium]